MWLGGLMASKLHPRIVIGVGVAIILGSIFISSFLTNFYWFILFYGVGYGFGSALLYAVPIHVGWRHFPNRKGIVSGVVIGSFGFGSFMFSLIYT